MNRWIAIAATVFVVGCHPHATPPSDGGRAHAIDIARLEGSRGAGLAKLVELARGGDDLAIRALGRVGGPTAIAALVALLPDGRAAAALGIACSLDEPDAALQQRLTRALGGRSPEIEEARGRCGDRSVEEALYAEIGGDAENMSIASAIALGRLGRRKIALDAAPRARLVTELADQRPAARYAAVWALAREHEPPKDPATIRALAARLAGDPEPEIRAQAALALAHEHAATDDLAISAVAGALADRDWRVQVEAARGLAASDATDRRAQALTATSPHAALEALAKLVKPLPAERSLGIPPTAATADGIAAAWIACRRAAIEIARRKTGIAALACPDLPEAYRASIAAELLALDKDDKIDGDADRATVVRGLVASADLRVKLAGLGAIASLGPAEQAAFAPDVVAALGDPTVAIAEAAIDAADPLVATTPAVATALLARAKAERDPELAAALLAAIGKHATGGLGAGREICTAALSSQPAIAAAAATCLDGFRDFGTKPAPPPPAKDPPPFTVPPAIDVATVIGKHLQWNLTTSRGPIAIALHPEIAPHAVAMIVMLTQKHFFDGLDFHRVVPDFVVQGGDPTMTGAGGPGFSIPGEPGGEFATGGVGIADAGRDTGGSQWFIMHSRAPHLDGRYTWFGQVTAGQPIADALQIGDKVLHAEIVPAGR